MEPEIMTDEEAIEEQKKRIAQDQADHAEDIMDADEAAGAEEGMDLREDNILEDVAEDRDATPPEGIELEQ